MPVEIRYEFGAFQFHPGQGLLFGPSGPQRLQAILAELLRTFLNHPLEILSMDQLIELVWGGDIATSNGAIAFQVHALRRALGDDARSPQYLRTLPKRGFQFLQNVRRTSSQTKAGELFEKARFHYHKAVSNDLEIAIRLYRQVIELHQDLIADSLAGLAEVYVLQGCFAQQSMPAKAAMEEARSYAQRALNMDPAIAEAHAALAAVSSLYDWDWAAANRHYRLALSLPSNPLVKPLIRSWYSELLAATGQHEKAREEITQAKAEFPTSSLLRAISGQIAYLARDPNLAIKECQAGLELENSFFLNHIVMGNAYRCLGESELAVQSYRRAARLTSNHPACLAELGHVLSAIDPPQGQRYHKRLERLSESRYISPFLLAHIAMGRKDFPSFFYWLDRAIEERSAYCVFLHSDPVFDAARSMPQFQEALSRVTLLIPDSTAV